MMCGKKPGVSTLSIRALVVAIGLPFAMAADAQDSYDYVAARFAKAAAERRAACSNMQSSRARSRNEQGQTRPEDRLAAEKFEKLFESMCAEPTDVDALWTDPEIWDETPTDPAEAVWEVVFLPIYYGEMSRRELRELAEATGLLRADIDALEQYAIDAIKAENDNQALLREEIVCSRKDSFETPSDWGRALAAVSDLRRAERPRVVVGLGDVIGLAATQRIIEYALAAKPAISGMLNRQSSFERAPPNVQEDIKQVACGDPNTGIRRQIESIRPRSGARSGRN